MDICNHSTIQLSKSSIAAESQLQALRFQRSLTRVRTSEERVRTILGVFGFKVYASQSIPSDETNADTKLEQWIFNMFRPLWMQIQFISSSQDALMPVTRRLSTLQSSLMAVVDSAANTIQRRFRGVLARKTAMKMREQMEKEHKSALVIQRSFRKHELRVIMAQHMLVLDANRRRKAAAIRIQSLWRGYTTRHELKVQLLAGFILEQRRIAAVKIQKIWRGSRCRRQLDNQSKQWAVTWPYDAKSSTVEIIGDFTKPEWQVRVSLAYSEIHGCFTTHLNVPVGWVKYKFIVNGSYLCDGSKAFKPDRQGNVNNIEYIAPYEHNEMYIFRQGVERRYALRIRRQQMLENGELSDFGAEKNMEPYFCNRMVAGCQPPPTTYMHRGSSFSDEEEFEDCGSHIGDDESPKRPTQSMSTSSNCLVYRWHFQDYRTYEFLSPA